MASNRSNPWPHGGSSPWGCAPVSSRARSARDPCVTEFKRICTVVVFCTCDVWKQVGFIFQNSICEITFQLNNELKENHSMKLSIIFQNLLELGKKVLYTEHSNHCNFFSFESFLKRSKHSESSSSLDAFYG